MPRLPLAALALAAVVVGCGGARAPWRIATADDATRRTTTAGDVVGGAARAPGAVAWLGIPYAAPPVGERRWRAPAPPAPWSGVRRALAFGDACPQNTSPFGGVEGPAGTIVGDEDCLTLNVWAPADATPASRLPVMFWIHGGGNTVGAAPFYDGARLAADQRVIVVTAQYRLGPFGWFRHPALAAGGTPAEASGDFAVLDLVQALGWVRDNATAFGGDPGRVTIFGESAGGANVYLLLLSPLSRGLFQRAIVESGGLWSSSTSEATDPPGASPPGQAQSSTEIVRRLLARHGDPDAAARATAADDGLAAWLRRQPAREIVAAYEPLPSGMIDMPRAIRDGVVLPARGFLEHLERPDGWNRVPVMAGTNRDEWRVFLFGEPGRITRRLWILPRFVDEPSYLASADAVSRMWKAVGADEPADAMTRAGAPVWVYRFDWHDEPTVLGADLSKMLGAAHGFEIPFVFGHFDLGSQADAIFTSANAPAREELSATMRRAWAAFARAGVPDPAWPAWRGDAPAGIVLDIPADGGVRPEPGRLTRAAVLAGVAHDPRLDGPRARCRVLRELAAWGRGFTRADYDARPDCSAFPWAGYPWAG